MVCAAQRNAFLPTIPAQRHRLRAARQYQLKNTNSLSGKQLPKFPKFALNLTSALSLAPAPILLKFRKSAVREHKGLLKNKQYSLAGSFAL